MARFNSSTAPKEGSTVVQYLNLLFGSGRQEQTREDKGAVRVITYSSGGRHVDPNEVFTTKSVQRHLKILSGESGDPRDAGKNL